MTTMHTLGQLARAIWPGPGEVPPNILDAMLVRPATGLALATQAAAAAKADPEHLAELVAKLPADLADPPGGVRVEDQGPFWKGYYHYLRGIDQAAKWGPEQLERAGRLLFGEQWQSDLARALGINSRRVREWLAGERRPAPGVWVEIAALLRQRSEEGLALLDEMERVEEGLE